LLPGGEQPHGRGERHLAGEAHLAIEFSETGSGRY
jgi:hypothetical protein